jgi:hypothetical protein
MYTHLYAVPRLRMRRVKSPLPHTSSWRCAQPIEAEAHPNPFLKENITLLHYKINFVMLFKEIIPVYSENHMKPINTKCRVTDC